MFLLTGQALVDYAAGLVLGLERPAGSRRFWLVLSLVANLTVLGYFKYFNFFVTSGAGLLQTLGLPVAPRALHVILPVGISFVTFQSMSYTIDVYRGRIRPVTSLVDYLLFVCFFTHLVAGPIVRAAHLLPQLEKPRRLATVDFRWCLSLFLIGFFKKSCISDHLALVVDQVYADPSRFTATSIWLATLFYAIQIYCDFSGYTDMAIACAALLGYDLGRNFDFPYFACNITAFWRRWHISLSNWLRDYLYVPLGGSRAGLGGTYRNLMLTMLLGGLWHGAGWTFLVWGALHGGALVLHKEWARRIAPGSLVGRIASILGPVLTFFWVCFAWIYFRAATLEDAVVASRAFLFLVSPGVEVINPQLLWLLLPAVFLHWAFFRGRVDLRAAMLPDWGFAACYGASIAVVLLLVPMAVKPFIYFQF